MIVSIEKEPKATCTITLSSPVMRDENQPEGGGKITDYKNFTNILNKLCDLFKFRQFLE